MTPARLPAPAKFILFGLAVGVLLALTLAPPQGLPSVSLWDKAQHALAWAVLTGLGLALWPARWRRVALFALALGGAVELIQGQLGQGRSADWRDLVADAVGILTALRLAQGLQRIRRRP